MAEVRRHDTLHVSAKLILQFWHGKIPLRGTLMPRLICAVLLIIGALPFGYGQNAPKSKPLPIVFDDWWNVDYVKSGCELAARNGKPCPLDRTPKDIVREFENELEVAFASESACHGLSLVHFTPEMASMAVKNPNAPAMGAMAKMAGDSWSFMLDLDGHSRTQVGRGWTLVDPSHNGLNALNGRITTPQRVMQQVCNIVRGVGGKAEN
jgi:hypothetical protein